MNMSYEVENLIAIYKEDTTSETIDEMEEAYSFLEEDEKTLKSLFDEALKVLQNMSENDFKKIEFTIY